MNEIIELTNLELRLILMFETIITIILWEISGLITKFIIKKIKNKKNA